MCLIVDSSKSVGVPNFVRVKTFLIQFIHQFDTETHFSVITFSRKPTVRCKFNSPQCQSPDATHRLISEIPDKVSWGTSTDKALIAADQVVFGPANGERADAANIIVIVTDGRTMKGSLPFNVTVPPLRVSVLWLTLGSFSNDSAFRKVFISYPRMSKLCRSIQHACRSKKTAQPKYAMTPFDSKGTHEILAIAVHVLQNTYDIVISRCCFEKDVKEKCKDSKRTYRPLFCSSNLLFGEVLVAAADVVC